MNLRLIVFLFTVLFLIDIGLACSCIMPATPQESLQDSPAVFMGTVVDIYEPTLLDSTASENVRVTFNVSKAWKGIETKEVTVRTAYSSASCGYEFEEGKDYIVYTYGASDYLRVSLCSRTAPLESAGADLVELGEGNIPTKEVEHPRWNFLAILNALFNIIF